MILLFPCEPFEPRRVDPDFVAEIEAARLAGFTCHLYSHEDLCEGEAGKAVWLVPKTSNGESTLIRGWMMPGEIYAALHQALVTKGYEPVTSPQDYETLHYLPLAYAAMADHTARSAWITGDEEEAAWSLYCQEFSAADAMLKDWVKSAKHQWTEACFIPAGTQRSRFNEIFRAFREERGKLFNRGVVFREFLPLAKTGEGTGGMPEVEEVRLFFWKGRLLRPVPPCPAPQLDRWQSIANRFPSPFFTMDVARLEDGSWKIIETGDGQVSGLPPELDPFVFYAALWSESLREA